MLRPLAACRPSSTAPPPRPDLSPPPLFPSLLLHAPARGARATSPPPPRQARRGGPARVRLLPVLHHPCSGASGKDVASCSSAPPKVAHRDNLSKGGGAIRGEAMERAIFGADGMGQPRNDSLLLDSSRSSRCSSTIINISRHIVSGRNGGDVGALPLFATVVVRPG